MVQSPLLWVIVALAIALAGLLAWRSRSRSVDAAGPVPAPASQRPASAPAAAGGLGQVKSWGYQLQNLDIARAAASPFDLLVIDYTRDGSEETRLTRAEIERLQRKPDGSRRIVLAYVSVGEAESYRPYWQASWKKDKPAWLLKENPDWDENYAVCFWDPAWQRLMCGSDEAYLDRVQAQGFDGVYLDKCDAFEDLRAHERRIAATRPDLERDMVGFVRAISRHLKARDPGFLVVMQNAELLLRHADLLAAIDGVAKEELLYGIDARERRNAPDEIAFSKSCLDVARAAGKPVLVVEYLGAHDKIATAAAEIERLGYILYVAPKDRALKRLNYDVLEA